MLYRLTLTKKNKFYYCFKYYAYLVPHFDHAWVPNLNQNKSLEPMSETPCKYFLHKHFLKNGCQKRKQNTLIHLTMVAMGSAT